jgi:hypothetical protein
MAVECGAEKHSGPCIADVHARVHDAATLAGGLGKNWIQVQFPDLRSFLDQLGHT